MSTPSSEHAVSPFALDVWFADGCPVDSPLHAHVASCAQCRAYVDALEKLAADVPPALDPARIVTSSPSASRRRGRNVLRFAAPAAAALALAASVALFVRREPASDGSYVGAKGAPAAQVLVRRNAKAEIWDGRTPIRPGDALAVRVDCERWTRVAVAAPRASGDDWTRVFAAPCAKSNTPLPFTLVADEAPGDERFAVVFSDAELDDARLASAAARAERSRDAWTLQIVVPKRTEKP